MGLCHIRSPTLAVNTIHRAYVAIDCVIRGQCSLEAFRLNRPQIAPNSTFSFPPLSRIKVTPVCLACLWSPQEPSTYDTRIWIACCTQLGHWKTVGKNGYWNTPRVPITSYISTINKSHAGINLGITYLLCAYWYTFVHAPPFLFASPLCRMLGLCTCNLLIFGFGFHYEFYFLVLSWCSSSSSVSSPELLHYVLSFVLLCLFLLYCCGCCSFLHIWVVGVCIPALKYFS